MQSSIYRASDGASFAGAGTGFTGGPFVGKILLDPNSPLDPNRTLFAAGSSAVFSSADRAGSWTQSTPSGVGAQGPFGAAIAVAPSSSAVVYAGLNGSVWRSSDGGATQANWKNVTMGNAPGSASLPPRPVGKIVVHPTDPDTIYVAFQGFNGQQPGHVFRSEPGEVRNGARKPLATAGSPTVVVAVASIPRPSVEAIFVIEAT